MSVDIEGHISRALDGALSSLHMRVVEMGGLALLQVRDAGEAYTDWSTAMAQAVLERERRLNALDQAVDEDSLSLIALRQPVASDLRTVIAMSRIVAELERAGDEAKKISLTVLGRAGRSGERPGSATARDARHLARLAANLLRMSLDALDTLDFELARKVVAGDRELDDGYADGLRRLLTRAMEDARHFNVALDDAIVLKSLERIGDHARNIARIVLSIAREGEAAPISQQPAATR